MGVFCDRLKLGSTAALNCQTGQNRGRYRKKELLFLLVLLPDYNNKLKILLGVKLHKKFKILCNNDWARASSPSSPAQLKTWVDPWNIWLADFRMGSWPCLTLLSLSIRSNCKLFLENYRSAESGASRIPLLLFNCSCEAVEGLGNLE